MTRHGRADASAGLRGRVDYDRLAADYDRRYEVHDYSGIEELLSSTSEEGSRLLEVGCGTGHWLRGLARSGVRVVGVDPSRQMLLAAKAALDCPRLVQAAAEGLPFGANHFDSVIAANALHHFSDPIAFFAEALRVLRPGGRILTIGLDPHCGLDRWYLYDYFPGVRALDQERYSSTRGIRAWLDDAGFVGSNTEIAQRIRESVDARAALDQGIVSPSATSQLALLSDEDFRAGIERIRHDIDASDSRGLTHRLAADLRLFATTATKPRGA